MLPLNGVCPRMAPRRVVLPAPFGPRRTWVEPRATARAMSTRSGRPSRTTLTASISSTAGGDTRSALRIGDQRLHHRVDVLLHLDLELVGREGARGDVADEVHPRVPVLLQHLEQRLREALLAEHHRDV